MGGTRARAARWVAPTALGVGAASVVATSAFLGWAWATGWQGFTAGEALIEAPWVLATALGLSLGVVVQRRAPGRPATCFAVVLGATAAGSLLDYVAGAAAVSGWDPWPTAAVVWLGQTSVVASSVASTVLLVTFPDGVVERWWERAVIRAAPVMLLVPLLLLVANPVVTTPWWADRPDVPSPLHVPGLTIDPQAASTALDLVNVMLLVSAAAVIARYRRSDQPRRARIRWVLLPGLVGAVGAITAALLRPPNELASGLFIAVQVTFYTAVALALLAPRGVDPDRVLRRSLVFGTLWLGITIVWVAVAAVAGLTAGRSTSLGWAVAVTMTAAVLFQPARTHLERLADRWVFGHRRAPTDVIAEMGRTLATTYELDSLLPRMADTLRDGLDLQWAQVLIRDGDGAGGDVLGVAAAGHGGDNDPSPAVRVSGYGTGGGDPDGQAVLTVPITRHGQRLGEVRCGPGRSGPLTAQEVELVVAFAHQAALAVGNVRLTHQLAEHAQKLEASRARLVRAQQAERRRIERNIHDGVQQDLVALISQAGRARRVLHHDPAAGERELGTLQQGLQRVLDDLRELARGIHPSVLTDHGLLVAVEALAARSPLPTTVRADASLRDGRLSEDVEGAAYFTVAEAVANTLKHADALHVDVSLARQNGSLVVEVTDDGCGMPRTAGALPTLTERVAAIGGELTITSAPDRGTTVRTRLPVDGVLP